jgi:hypothetical protein
MDENEAREILGPAIEEEDKDQLNFLIPGGEKFISWRPGRVSVTLDDDFCVEELEAIVWWMKNKK